MWSLGVMLYECLSGRRPFDGARVFDVLAKIAGEEPPALRTVVRAVPRDLHTIVAKCLTKEPALRYPSAKELADGLGRVVRGEPISARPVRLAKAGGGVGVLRGGAGDVAGGGHGLRAVAGRKAGTGRR